MGHGMFLVVLCSAVLVFLIGSWVMGRAPLAHGAQDLLTTNLLPCWFQKVSVGPAAAMGSANCKPIRPRILLLEPYYLPCLLQECPSLLQDTTNGDYYHQDCDIIIDASARFVDVLLNYLASVVGIGIGGSEFGIVLGSPLHLLSFHT
jgi:hypothetical protein